MPTSPLNVVIQHLLADLRPNGDGATDGELLARFLRSRDHDALAALVRRHARMVWGVSSRLLHNRHDAEDAFQATFLVLVRKAAGVPRQAVANWLYGVARQTAVRLRATGAKRGRRETQVLTMPELEDRSQGSGVRDQEWSDVQRVLDEELGRLPDHYRGVIVQCDLEGMTRKEAARQLGIPEGSVASRLARARLMLARRLTQRGVDLSGTAVAAMLAAGPASASAPPALVASTIKAVTLLAAGRAAGVISAKVAALAEGMVKTMFMTKIKAALSVVLILGFVATVATLLTYRAAAGQHDKKPIAEKSAPLAAKLEQEKDEVAFTAWGKEIDGVQAGLGFRPGEHRAYHAGETVKLVVRVRNFGKEAVTFQYLRHFFIENPPTVVDDKGKAVALKDGAPKGIYKPVDVTLAAGKEVELYELTLTLSEKNSDPPQVSTLHGKGKFQLQYERILGESALSSLAIHIGPSLRKLATGKLELEVKEKPPAAKTDEERMIGGWVIVNNDGDRKRKGELWSIGKHQIVMNANLTGFRGITHFHRLDAAKNPKQIDITVTGIAGVYGPDVPIKADARIVGVIKGIYAFTEDNELRLCLGEMGKDRPTEFAGKPGQSEVLVLQRAGAGQPEAKEEKLRVLIDKVLAAHGGEDKLNKLQFTMTVKHSNGETQQYFVQPPKNFRWETTHPDSTSKRIVILFPEGRRWWRQEPKGDAKEFRPTGLEPLSVEGWLDYVKFFGPRQVLRLKDAGHKAALLDEEAKIGGRAAVGMQVTGPHYNHTMYFDKETHLLLKGVGSDILREVTYSDYKTFDGIPIAQKEHDGHFMPEVTDFRAVEKLGAKLFEQP